jgi:predicted nucleic acid-binding Zn ribbon protein
VSRRRVPRPAGTAVGALAGALAPQTLLGDVQRVWPAVAGDVVAVHATPAGERAGTLVIACDAAVWAQELDLMGPELVERLNAALGAPRVRALRCQAAPARGWAPEAL